MKTDLGLLFLRAATGLMLMGHGWGKVQGLFAGKSDFPDPLGIGSVPSLALAAFAEFLCALLVVIGFRVRWTAIPPAITMLVAAFVFHAGDPFNTKEKALLFAIPFIALIFTGPGRYAFDPRLGRRRRY